MLVIISAGMHVIFLTPDMASKTMPDEASIWSFLGLLDVITGIVS